MSLIDCSSDPESNEDDSSCSRPPRSIDWNQSDSEADDSESEPYAGTHFYGPGKNSTEDDYGPLCSNIGRYSGSVLFWKGQLGRVYVEWDLDQRKGACLQNDLGTQKRLREDCEYILLDFVIRGELLRNRLMAAYKVDGDDLKEIPFPGLTSDSIKGFEQIPYSQITIHQGLAGLSPQDSHCRPQNKAAITFKNQLFIENSADPYFVFRFWELGILSKCYLEEELESYQVINDLPHVATCHGVVILDDGGPDKNQPREPPVAVGYIRKHYPQGDLTRHYETAEVWRKERWVKQLLEAVEDFESVGYKYNFLCCRNILIDGDYSETERIRIVNFQRSGYHENEWVHPGARRYPVRGRPVFTLAKTVWEIMKASTPPLVTYDIHQKVYEPKGGWPNEIQRDLVHVAAPVLESIKEEMPGWIGELIWLCCGDLENTPTIAEVREKLKAKFEAYESII